LNQFSEPVDFYGAYTLGTNPSTVYVLGPGFSFQALPINAIVQSLASGELPAGVEPWMAIVQSSVYENLFTTAISNLSPGLYSLYLLATPAGSLLSYYLWETTLSNSGNQLTVTKVGSGTVTSSDGLISCGVDCSQRYNNSTAVTLTATPAPGYIFSGWSGCDSVSGNSCSITVTTDRAVTSTFTIDTQSYTLTVSRNGSGTGTVTSSPAGIFCGTDCSETYPSGTTVFLAANPQAGSSFSGWSGACSGTGTCQVTMNSNTVVTATFTQEGGTGIFYDEIVLTWNGSNYTGILFNELISVHPAQNFYRVTRNPSCSTTIQFALAGSITAQANENMLVSNRDFGTKANALSVYQQFLNTTGYEVFTEEVVGGATYWYWFAVSYESEFIPIFNPTDTTYYIQIVNESNFTGIYRIEAYCW
jgi:hypothetical protein